jgi:hypothetical protein
LAEDIFEEIFDWSRDRSTFRRLSGLLKHIQQLVLVVADVCEIEHFALRHHLQLTVLDLPAEDHHFFKSRLLSLLVSWLYLFIFFILVHMVRALSEPWFFSGEHVLKFVEIISFLIEFLLCMLNFCLFPLLLFESVSKVFIVKVDAEEGDEARVADNIDSIKTLFQRFVEFIDF